MALKQRLAIIQGPPGTGKTTVVANIVSQWKRLNSEKILICAPSNTAADFIAQKLNNIS
jgi:DNA helicase IV